VVGVVTRRARRAAPAVQEALFEVAAPPGQRYFRQILDALGRSEFGRDRDTAERVVSRLCGAVWAGQDGPRDGQTEEAFGLALVEHARAHWSPAAVALLRTLAVVAPIREVRTAAATAADAMVAEGLPEPSWAPDLAAGRAWVTEDVFGDRSIVVCELGSYAVVVEVDHALGGPATDVAYRDDVESLIRELTTDARVNEPLVRLRQVEPPWARAFLDRAFARTDLLEGVAVSDGFAELRALALARIRLLPESAAVADRRRLDLDLSGPARTLVATPDATLAPDRPPLTPTERRAIVDEFVAGSPLDDSGRGVTARLAEMIVTHSAAVDPGDVTRVGPAKWEAFHDLWLPRSAPLDEAEQAALPHVVRAWTAWAARRQQLPDAARAELDAALDDLFPRP
jgi:hypothetical protein